ncbi:hypothetical protein T4A_2760 [Trichinella pseudospiralis]|uniref:Uncharacterized protein n=1 Tax=Trichinella pseudospiralis TaxID=6337 RepID=A0A0V1EP84_TRIPS|nr:hypothetical protein T4A_2760 [Trichinella pseudospiralis]KRZ39462.1 hypothetical protein T4C_4913 [Trichinella pseudospiralis]
MDVAKVGFVEVLMINFYAVKVQDEENWIHLYLASKISVSHFSTSLLISQPQRGLQHLAIDKQSTKLV